ncbi:MAG: TrmJ/YjtD family RNA methyltransferase [Treponema sp.]|nr:TrmJ/YjtD family RNA methyltransferase [Treponema sp.]
MLFTDLIIILCRVTDAGNIGAVCRAMKNMGLSRLRLAAQQPVNGELVRTRAIHAADVWEQAQFFDTLAGAAADCSILVGTTRRRGRHRKSVTMDPRTLASWLVERHVSGAGPAAIVFGNERTGLEEAELDLCNIASHVPVSDDFPSLNLSHAVQIYAYELFLAIGSEIKAVKGEWTALNRSGVEALVSSITDTLSDIGFYKYPGREVQYRFLRDVISRAGLTEREGNYLKDIFAKAARLGSMAGGSLVK